MRGIEAIIITTKMVFDDELIMVADTYKSFYTSPLQKSSLIPLLRKLHHFEQMQNSKAGRRQMKYYEDLRYFFFILM
jgi:hypothetical protein